MSTAPQPVEATGAHVLTVVSGNAALGTAFWRLWTANLLSETGSQLSRVALVLALAGGLSPIAAVALLVFCETLPGSAVAFISGAIVDRGDKRIIMIAADVIRAALVGLVALNPTGVFIYAMAAIKSMAGAFFSPARSALVPRVVDTKRLTKANSMDQASSTIVMIAAPMLGAQLYIWFGLKATLLLDAASFLVSAALVFGIRLRYEHPAVFEQSESPLASVWQGWRYIGSNVLARHLLALTTVSLLCVGLWIPVAPAFIREFLGSPGSVLGVQLSLFGIGGFCGSLMAAPLAARFGKGHAVTIALLGEATAMIAYSVTRWPALSGGIIFLWGTIVSIMVVSFNALLQEHVPGHFLGRVFAVLQQLESSATVLAVLLAAALEHVLTPQGIFFAAGVTYLSLIAASARMPGGRVLMRTI